MKQTLLVAFIAIFTFGHTQNIILEEFGPTFFYPTNIGNAGDSRMFVSEQGGYIYIVRSNGTVPSTPFLDIESKVADDYQSNWEAGLLGFAFHPNYSSNGYVYVYYTKDNEDAVLARFTISSDPDVLDASSELIIMDMPHPYDAHYGGNLAFGPDGYLYISKGDGGTSAGDPDNRAQSLDEWHGKMLRIDVDNPDPGKNYGIPPGNPYATDGDPNTLPEIWSFGLRNPAKFSFDGATGDLWIGDVGQWDYEDIHFAAAGTSGHNFGWRCYEGVSDFNTAGCPPLAATDVPLHVYGHNTEPDGVFRCAVAGGYVHRGSVNTNLNGIYFFGDWCSGDIMMLTYNGSSWVRTKHNKSGARWVAFGEDTDGELYALTNPLGNGRMYKIKQDTLTADEKIWDGEFTIVPNPAEKSEITLNFSKAVDIKNISVYNLHGQKIRGINVNRTLQDFTLDFKGVSSGIYLIEAISNSGEKTQNKLIIK